MMAPLQKTSGSSLPFVVLLLFCACVHMAEGCQCPDNSCMKISHTPRRCECCVFTFLGKRTPNPSVNSFSKKEAVASYSSYADQSMADLDYWFRLSGLSEP
uniref:Uncharacterized protein LOC111122239 n=1 Tax=Crassostrea virginica TaxID=6565 RepID=A0A8B8CUV8_CRAVI|nr:uncharacterized protein LOC111122239 [Crassostrea virginica]